MNILAIEVSTASAKALLYSSDKGVLQCASIPYSKEISDIATQDATGVYQAMIHAVKKINESQEYHVEAISICTTWHSLLLLDQNRRPVDRIITWANHQAAETSGKYRADASFSQWYYHKTGCMVNCTYPYWQYRHYQSKYPEKMKEVHFLSSQQEYIFEQLTGEIAASKSTASGSGFLNIHSLDWDDDLLKLATIDRAQMAPLHEPDYVAPLTAQAALDLKLTPGIPVLIGSPDGGMNQIGAGGTGRGIMTLSVGTSGALRLITEEPLLYQNPATWCYYLGDNRRIAGAATSGAGNCVEWFVNNYGATNGNAYLYLNGLLPRIKIENAPLFLPFLFGERCPGWNDERSGGFVELKADHAIGDLYYAVLEGVLFNLYQCYRILANLNGEPEQIIVSGGILRSGFWTQMVADIFQKEITACEFEQQSLLGAAVYGLKVMQNKTRIDNSNPERGRRIMPNKESDPLYNKRFEGFLNFYHKL